MKGSQKNHTSYVLACGLLMVSTGLAQTCNTSIPLTTPSGEFTDHGDGTVTHHRTGLMWKICLEGQSGAGCEGTPTGMNWSQALTHAGNHEFAGYINWHLPNIKELPSIAEFACYLPAINLSLFPNDPGSDVWSSSPDTTYSNSAWGVSFSDGDSNSGSKGGNYYVRLVRDGPSTVLQNPTISANPDFGMFYEPIELSWNTGGHLDCMITGPAFDYQVNTETGSVMANVYVSNYYTISCDNGSVTDQVYVELIPGSWE